LLDQLQHCDNFIDADGEKIRFTEGEYRLQVFIFPEKQVPVVSIVAAKDGTKSVRQKREERWTTDLALISETDNVADFTFVSENYAFALGKMMLTEPIGAAFSQVMNFKTTFDERDMVKYLSLLYSYVDNIKVVYNDFRFEKSTNNVVAEPCLFFEKVDADNSLHLRIGQSLPKLGVDFLDEYEIYRFADINDLERVVYIRNIDQQPTEGYVAQIEKLLAKHSGGGNRFRVSYDTFLKDCKTRQDLKYKINLFKQTVNIKLPANWNTFLDELTLKAHAIETTENVVVLKLPETDRHLHSLIAQDSNIKALVAKAENFQIIVLKDNVAKLKARLKDYGYLLD
jgi:hypothetical protein